MNRFILLVVIGFFQSLELSYADPPTSGASSPIGLDRTFTKSDREKRENISTCSKPLGREKIFYRWGNPRGQEIGPYNRNVYNDVMSWGRPGVSESSYGGRGLYISASISDSSQYAGSDAKLMKLRIDPGVPELDLLDASVMACLIRQGITREDVFYLDPPLLVRYKSGNPTWYVLKALDGVRFEEINAGDVGTTFDGFHRILKQIKSYHAKAEFGPYRVLTFSQRSEDCSRERIAAAAPVIEVEPLESGLRLANRLVDYFQMKRRKSSTLQRHIKEREDYESL